MYWEKTNENCPISKVRSKFRFLSRSYLLQNIRFSSIRVNSPVVLVVNSKKLGIEKQAPTILTVSAKSE